MNSRFTSRVSKGSWLILLLFCAAGPFVFAVIQGHWALLHVSAIQLVGASTKSEVRLLICAMDMFASLVAAAILGFPLGYLVRQQPRLLGAVVAFFTVAFLIFPSFAPQTDVSVSSWVWVLSFVDYASFAAGCIAFSNIGARTIRVPG